MLVDIPGGSNPFDVDIGGNASAEYPNFDLVILGSSKRFPHHLQIPNVWAAQGTGETCGTNCTGTSSMAGIIVDVHNALLEF